MQQPTLTRRRRAFASGLGLVGFALLAACSSGPTDRPHESDVTVKPPSNNDVEKLKRLGSFEAVYDDVTKTITIHELVQTESGAVLRVKVDSETTIPSSSTGIPTGGGIVAYSPSAASSCGTGCVSGPIRLVNRKGSSSLLRNVFAVVTGLSTGWTLSNSDGARSFSLPAATGYLYYEHLSPAGYPSESFVPSETPGTTVGFRADRTWKFTGTGSTFSFTFDVYGHEVACTPVGAESPSTTGATVDNDCDGVPGAARGATIFVDPVNGVDSTTTNNGTVRLPYKTAHFGVSQASATRPTVVLASGSYAPPTTTTPAISTIYSLSPNSNTARILGGYDGPNGFTRDATPSPSATLVTTARTPASRDAFGLVRSNASLALYLQYLEIDAPDGAAGSASLAAGTSYGARIVSSNVSFDNVIIKAGNGAAGTAGTAGTNGAAGAAGTAGVSGGSGGAAKSCSTGGSSGAGGAGGVGNTDTAGNNSADGVSGGDASTGTAVGGAGGARGLIDICDPSFPENGSDADPTLVGAGNAGTNGAQASDSTLVSSWFSLGLYSMDPSQHGTSGTNGTPGGGGGGGGGGGTCNTVSPFPNGGHGGGGGSGGCGGKAGTGGRAGGGSIVLMSSGATITFASTTLTPGAGGNGGAAAAGGNGGNGGLGRNGQTASEGTTSTPLNGGKGANGGAGGTGGYGSGGNGGPSICIVNVNGGSVAGSGYACGTLTAGTGGAGLTGFPLSAGKNGATAVTFP